MHVTELVPYYVSLLDISCKNGLKHITIEKRIKSRDSAVLDDLRQIDLRMDLKEWNEYMKVLNSESVNCARYTFIFIHSIHLTQVNLSVFSVF